MAAKKENDLIQAAVAARMAGKEVNADDLAAQLPEGVEAVPEYSVEDSKEKLLEIAAQLGVEVKKTASKAQVVAALDAEIAANTVDGETADALLAQKGGQLRVAAASLVAGHIKGHHPHFAELFQRFIDGRTVLVQPEPCSVLTHVFPPSLIPMQTKKRKYHTKSADLRFEKHLNAPLKAPGRNTRVQRPLRMIQKDGIMRVYIAILLLLLFIDRFTSLHTDCAISWL